jgi:hypothetical protein
MLLEIGPYGRDYIIELDRKLLLKEFDEKHLVN